jgi:hypothetical protein
VSSLVFSGFFSVAKGIDNSHQLAGLGFRFPAEFGYHFLDTTNEYFIFGRARGGCIVAKAKPGKSSKTQSAAIGKARTGALKSNEKPSAGSSPMFTGISIGHAAGEVWGFLSGGAPRTIAEIKKAVNAPGDVVVAAIGWLAREDKLEFVTNGKTVRIGLR